MLTLSDIRDKLKDLDEVTLIELLGVNTEQIVDAFEDIIEDRADELGAYFDDNTDSDEEE